MTETLRLLIGLVVFVAPVVVMLSLIWDLFGWIGRRIRIFFPPGRQKNK